MSYYHDGELAVVAGDRVSVVEDGCTSIHLVNHITWDVDANVAIIDTTGGQYLFDEIDDIIIEETGNDTL